MEREKKTKIYLYKNGNHFDVINSMSGFYATSYYYKTCNTPYQNKEHNCEINRKNVGIMCKKLQHNKSGKNKIYCKECNRYCYATNNVLKITEVFVRKFTNVWNVIKFASGANTIIVVQEGALIVINFITTLRCLHATCSKKIQKGGIFKQPCICNVEVDAKSKPSTYTEKYIWFDYEAQQQTGVHEAHYLNSARHTFKTNKEFFIWLISKKHVSYMAIAHNTKVYDSQFILQFCVENSLKPYTIYNGTKIMILKVGPKIKSINSYNFFCFCPF